MYTGIKLVSAWNAEVNPEDGFIYKTAKKYPYDG